LTSAVGGLDHDGGVALGGGFHACVRGGGTAHTTIKSVSC
jgi:hypothetical protein